MSNNNNKNVLKLAVSFPIIDSLLWKGCPCFITPHGNKAVDWSDYMLLSYSIQLQQYNYTARTSPNGPNFIRGVFRGGETGEPCVPPGIWWGKCTLQHIQNEGKKKKENQ